INDASGANLWSPARTITDSNGNTLSVNSAYTTYTDTLSTTAMTAAGVGAAPFAWTDVSTGSPQVSVTNTSMTLQSVFGCTLISDYNIAAQSLPTSVSFPNSTTLGITYEGTFGHTGNYTGRLGSLTLPTGGTITYAYSGSNNGIDCGHQITPTLKRTTSDGTTEYD